MRIFLWFIESLAIISTLVGAGAFVVAWREKSSETIDPTGVNSVRKMTVSGAITVVGLLISLTFGWWLTRPQPTITVTPILPQTVLPPVGTFYLSAITPAITAAPSNAAIRLFFSQPLNEASVRDFGTLASVTVNNALLPGAWALAPTDANAAVSWMEFHPAASCAASPKQGCFSDNARVGIALKGADIRNRSGASLSCSNQHPCEREISIGTGIDTIAPTGSWITPRDGSHVSANDQVIVLVGATDDRAISHGVLLSDGSPVAWSAFDPSANGVLTITWSTIGKKVGQTAKLQVRLYDTDGNGTMLDPITVTFDPPKALSCTYAWTFTPTPGLPLGAECRFNYDCASRYCVGGICVEGKPIITAITPDNGIAASYANTYVTITGKNFGRSQDTSIVKFGDLPAGLGCSRWSNNEIIAQAPPTLKLGSYPVTVTTSAGTSNVRPFTSNTTIRPAVCTLDPDHGAVTDPVALRGDNLGDTRQDSVVKFIGIPVEKYGSWSDASAEVEVPNRSRTGYVLATVVKNQSNPVTFTMDPFIDHLSPDRGPEGGWMTIIGGNFGYVPGKVIFEGDPKDPTDDAQAILPEECAGSAWSDRWVIVQIPKGAKNGLVRLTTAPTTPAGALTTKPQQSGAFTLTQDPIGPGLCRLIPSYGLTGDSIVARGVRFGKASDARGVTLGRLDARYQSWTPESVRWRVPDSAESDDVVLRTVIHYNIRQECRWVTFRGVCPWGLKTVSDQAEVASNGLPFDILTSRDLQCSVDADCPFGRCVNGRCQSADNGQECRADSDCRPGFICDLRSGQCRPPGCDSNDDCRDGEICNTLLNICVPLCSTDVDCPYGMQCIDGSCRPPQCRSDVDCQNGQTCDPVTNTCVGGHCTNLRRDADETNVDCGGADCRSCGGLGGGHCANGIQDADETGIDCGGADCQVCNVVDCPLERPVLIGDQCYGEECGDGTVQSARGEQCDDGNTSDGDGCSGSCQLEDAKLCGNNRVDPGEQCDAGGQNGKSGVGCTNTCQRTEGQETVPYPPDLAATDGSSRIAVDWVPNPYGPQPIGFTLYRSTQPILDAPVSLPTVSCGNNASNANNEFCRVSQFEGNIRHYNDGAIKPNTLYHYRILGYNDAGDSALSNAGSAKTCSTCGHTGAEPFPPTLTATDGVTATIIQWDPNSQGPQPTGYRLYRSRSQIPDEPALPLPTVSCGTSQENASDAFCLASGALAAGDREYRDRAVTSNVLYHYRILGIGADGDSALSNPASAKACPTCGKDGTRPFPPVLSATEGAGSVHLVWQSNSNGAAPKGYRLYRSTQAIPDEVENLPTVSCGTDSASASAAFCFVSRFEESAQDYSDQAVVVGTIYHYRILAFNDAGDSPSSNNAFAKATIGTGPSCGNGDIDSGEQCDDGNTSNGDGCSAQCELENPQLCGNNAINPGEQCDDGNRNNGDGCDATCQYEDGGSGAPFAPQDLTATNSPLNAAALTLSWSVSPAGARPTGFRLYRSRQAIPDAPTSLPTDSCGANASTASDAFCLVPATIAEDAETAVDGAVKPDTVYHYRILAYNGVGDSPLSNPASASMCTTCNSVPGIPRNLAAAPADENIRITWQPPLSAGSSPIDQYTVYRKVGNAGEQVFYRNVDNAAALLLDDANLENGTVYCYAVSAVNGHGEGEVTDQRCATPTASGVVPGMPRNVVADGLDRRIVLTWEAPASAGTTAIGKYTVYRREGNDGALIYLKDVTTLTNLRLEDSGLANGRVYCYAVSAHNQQGEGVAASEECATPTAVGEVPGVPRTLTVQGLVEHATIRWQAPASSGTGAILGFRIYRRNGNGGSFAFLRQVSETVIDDEGLAPGSVMCYQVAAYNAMGEGEATIEECATVIGMAPFKPDDLSATDDGQAVEVRWLPNTEGAPFDEYRLYRSRQPIPDELATLPTTSCGAQGSAAGDQLCLVGVFDRSQTRYGDDAVRSNLLYHYRILAYNEWGLSPLSDPASGKICPDCEHDGTEPYRPNLSAWADDGTIALEWSPHPSGPGVLGFRLYRDDSVIADEPELPLPTNPCPTTPGSGSGAFCLVATFVNPMERDYRDRTVQQDVPYHYRILAYNAVGDSELSNNASATMEIGPGPKLLDHVNIIVDPGPDTPATSDSFACGGTRCADDRGSDPGVQHRWSAQACSADGDCRLDASFEWAVGQGSSGVAGVQLSNHQRQSTNQGDDLFATPVDNGSFDVTVIARQINGRSARKTMRVTVALPLVRSVEIFDSQNRPFPTGGRDEYARDGQAQHQYRIRVYDIATPTSDEQRDAHEIEAALDWWIGSFTNLAFEVNGDRADSQIRVNSLPEIAIAHNYPEGYLGISAWGLPGFSSAGSSVNNWITLAYAGIDQGPRLPDLTIESLSALTCDGASANLPVCSGMIRRTHYGQVVIKNQGSIAAMRDFPVSIYWNNKLLWLDTWPRQEPKRMDPGATLTLQFILPSDINVNQPNALRVVLDSLDQDTEVFPDSSSEYVVTQIRGNPSYRDNMIQESDEENNGRQVIVGRNLPDLAFTASPFERFEEGGIWKLKFRAINLGPGVVTQNFAALLYENGIFKESTFATPIPGGSGVIPPLDSPLDPDAVVDVVFQDPTQSLATYRSVRLDLDGLRSVEETDETNNSLTIGLGGEVKRLDLIAPQSLGMLRQLRLQRATTADEELPLTNIYSDSFLCAGRDTCPDDMDGPANTVCPDPAAADYWQAMSRLINYSASDPFAQWENCYYGLKGRTGVQHRYLLQAYADQEGTQPLWLDVRAEVIPSNPRLDTLLTLSDLSGTPANMLNKQLGFYQRLEPKPSTSAQWTVLPNSIHASNRLSGVYVTANGDAGTSTIRFTAEGDGVYAQGGTSATRSLNVEVFPCEHPWPSQVGAFPFDDTRDYANRFLFNQYDATMHLRSGNFSRIPGEQSINGQYQSFSIGYCRDGVPLEEVRSDAFSCVGDRCSDDDDPATAGNQHLFKVEGYDQNGTQIKTGLTYTWASSDGNNNIVRIHSGQDEPGLGSEQLAISSVGNGTANITVTVGQGTLSRTMVMPVSVTWLRQGSGLNVPVAPISQSIEPRYRIADNEGASGILSSIKVYAMPKLLPDLRLQSVELPRLRTPASQRLKQFYFREPGAPDLIALTVMQNGQQFSAARWYLESNAVVNPRADRASVSSIDCQNRRTYAPTLPEGEDCVDGIQEGDTWYYTMARLRDDDVLDNTVVGSDGMTARSRYKQLFTNVYLLSITKDARKEMQSVVPQLLNRWKFALNIDDPGVRTALKRDVRRASDLRDLEVRLKNYATQNSKFPELTAGTFIRGLSYSTWPSWQETLKENLDGGPRIASDPLNYFVGCNRPHDPQTCWDEAAKNFQCPSAGNARAYVYSAKGPNNVPSIADGYLGTFFEVWPSSRPGFSRDREIGDPFSALTPGPFVNGVASNVAKSIGANGCNANLLRLNKP